MSSTYPADHPESNGNDPLSASDFSSLEGAFADAPDEAEFANVPDGKYQARVERVNLMRGRTSNKKMLEWDLVITDGEYEGRHTWKYTLLEEPEHMKFAKRDLLCCGLKLERISDLPQHLEELLNVTIPVTLKTKGDFQSVYFRSPGQAPAAGSGNGSAETSLF